MKVVIEVDNEGVVYVQIENEKHHKRIQNRLATTRRSVESLKNECRINNGEYVILNLK